MAAHWQTLQELFDRMLDLPSDARAAELHALAARDADLHAELRALLAAHRGENALAELVQRQARALTQPERSSGQRFGPYRIVAQIGAGGMGIVYRAVDERLGRSVALKVLHPRLSAVPAARERFLREARLASSLDHPGLCAIFDVGELADATPYIAMRFQEGETLDRKIARGPIALGQALDWATQVARGLGCAHRSGVLHRDIKPSNLIVSDAGRVSIVDFGIATADGADTTAQGVGTCRYMAPEQFSGEPPTPSTDLRALCLVLFEMLTGCQPYEGLTPPQTIYRVCHEDPSFVERAALPAGVSALLIHGLARDPRLRFQSAQQLLDALAALSLGEWPPEPISEPARDVRQLLAVRAAAPIGASLQEAVAALAERYDGAVLDPGALEPTVIFGVHASHDNDPQRAAHLARALLQRVPSARAAIAWRREPLCASVDAKHAALERSAVVSAAAALLTQARAGEVLVDDDVAVALVRDFDLSREAELTRIIAERSGSLPPARRPLVGRSEELQQLISLLDASRAWPGGRVASIRGPAGIGKTRLLEELLRLAIERGVTAYTLHATDYQAALGRDPRSSLVAQLLDLPNEATIEARHARARSFVARGAVSDDQLVFLLDLLNVPLGRHEQEIVDTLSEAERSAGTQATVSALLADVSARAPALIAIEDVHWADDETLATLDWIVRASCEYPVLLVMTTRPEADPLSSAWREGLGATRVHVVELAPLSSGDAQQLAAAFGASADELAAYANSAEGNPLYLEQLIESGRGPETVPPSIDNLVAAQLDRLEPGERRALQLASVLGPRFDGATVQALLGGEHDAKTLRRSQLVLPDGGGLRFKHALIHAAVYQSLTEAARREQHERVAAYYGRSDTALCAEHLERAGSLRAAGAYLVAGQERARHHRYQKAHDLAVRGLALCGDRSQRAQLLSLRAEALLSLGRSEEAVAAFEAALALEPPDDIRCRVAIGLSSALRVVDRIEAALELLAQAQRLAEANEDSELLTQIHNLRGGLYFPAARIEECRREQASALLHAERCGSDEHRASALSGLCDAEYAGGRMISAFRYAKECSLLCERAGLRRVEAANRFMLATTRIYLGETAVALQDAVSAAALAESLRHYRAEIVSRLTAAWILIDMRREDEALVEVERGRAIVSRIGARRFEPFLLESRARILYAQGALEQAEACAAEAAELCLPDGARFIGPWVLSTLALCTRDSGARDAALARATALLEAGAIGHNHYRFYQQAIEAELRAGRIDRVRALASAFERYVAMEPTAWSVFHIERARALCDVREAEPGPDGRARLERLLETARARSWLTRCAALEAALGLA